ncbi:MAG TPA: TerC/Alx family metal homeostasis membrane protein [Polyangiaceae bacterium]|nr:TerC/Alx family metal homeostasis membrane protein [Polyangiaceae bacterium]
MQTWAWISIIATLALSLGVDLFVHRRGRATTARSASIWTVIWVSVGIAFGAVVYAFRGAAAVPDYYAAYLIEESLSVDNLFVFLIIFQGLRVPLDLEHHVLFLGVLGALVFRALFVLAGAAALERWQWVSYVFGAILVIAAIRAARSQPGEGDNPLIHWLSEHLPVSKGFAGRKFVTVENGRRLATPLLIALVGLEISDVFFAIDSVPAALSISRDQFVVYSSNALAICGLRSLFLVLRSLLRGLPHLHYGIAAVLLFTGLKMISHPWVDIPSWVSILVSASCIGLAVLASLRAKRDEAPSPSA